MANRLDIRTLLRKHGLRPKKSWSQNFLVDLDVLQRIALAAELGPDDVVVELGAGLGALTALLAGQAARVVAVERDRDLARVLRSEFAGDARVELLEANAATLDWPGLVERLGRPPVVIGNLPYHMASQILFHLLEAGTLLARWVLMVQREMAQRLTAAPGGRDYGVLSVQVQLAADVETALDVAPDAFLPSPRVHSRVVVGRTLSRPRVAAADHELLRELVRGVFGQRRKQIRNSLKAGWGERLGMDAIDAALAEAGIGPQLRPEQLELERFARLSDAIGARLEAIGRGRHQ